MAHQGQYSLLKFSMFFHNHIFFHLILSIWDVRDWICSLLDAKQMFHHGTTSPFPRHHREKLSPCLSASTFPPSPASFTLVEQSHEPCSQVTEKAHTIHCFFFICAFSTPYIIFSKCTVEHVIETTHFPRYWPLGFISKWNMWLFCYKQMSTCTGCMSIHFKEWKKLEIQSAFLFPPPEDEQFLFYCPTYLTVSAIGVNCEIHSGSSQTSSQTIIIVKEGYTL